MTPSKIQTGAPTKIMFIRHAEKMIIPKEMKDALPGEEEFSIGLALSLSMFGEVRAQALGILFSQNKFMQHYLGVLQKRIILKDEKEIEQVCHKHLRECF